jgi:hypothetical protein
MQPDAPQIPIKIEEWQGEIAKARAARKQVSIWWDANLDAYAPSPSDNPEDYAEAINTNRDFTLVERKKADLFYQRPDVFAKPSPLFEGKDALLETHTKILNEKLGPDGVNARAMAHRVIFDILCTAGMGWTAMGFESSTVPVDMQVPGPDAAMPGAVLNLQPVPQMITQSVDVPIFERVFWEWFSPKQGLIPAHARTTDSDTWPWIGMEFEVPTRTAIRNKWVPADHKGGPGSTELHFDHGITGQTGDDVVRGVLIYYMSSLYRDDRPHPQHQTQLILIDGIDDPAVHKDSPYQELDAQGRLTPNSLIGYPIHPGTIRTLTDTAYVPSDCTISRPLVNELNTGRRQMIEQRENTLLRYQYNVDTLPPDALAKIVRSPIGGFIGVPAEAFVGDGAIKEIPHGTWPRENNEFNNYLDNDLARTHAIDAEQSGASAAGDQTATESQIKQNNVNARMGVERGNFLDWYLRGVTKFSQIAMRLLPTEDAAKIVGPAKAQEWDSWRGQIPAALAFTALPDSSLRTDQAIDRKRAMDEYTFLINASGISKPELTKQLLPKIGYPATVLDLAPPQPHPEPTRPNFSFKGEDLNPLAPQFAIVMEILRQAGVSVSPHAVQEAQSTSQNALLAQQVPSQDTGLGHAAPSMEHGGKLPQLEGLSKHAAALTGGMQGMPNSGAGGGVQ